MEYVFANTTAQREERLNPHANTSAAVKINEINPKYEFTQKIHRLLTNQKYLCLNIKHTNLSRLIILCLNWMYLLLQWDTYFLNACEFLTTLIPSYFYMLLYHQNDVISLKAHIVNIKYIYIYVILRGLEMGERRTLANFSIHFVPSHINSICTASTHWYCIYSAITFAKKILFN